MKNPNTMMTEATDYQQWLADCLKNQSGNIACHTLPNDEKVWVRRADAHNSIWLYRLLGVFTAVLRADALKPVPSLGGKAAIENEAAALKRLSQRGVIVPKLLALCDNALMISHFADSQTLMHTLSEAEKQSPQALLDNWQRGVAAIAEVHEKDEHLSQCFSRNMMRCHDGKIGFIDFEDAPEKVLNLKQCQTRDWLCYLHSTAFLLDNDDNRRQAVEILRTTWGKKADNLIDDLYRNTRFLGWLRHIQHRRWGRDTLRLAALMRLMRALKMD